MKEDNLIKYTKKGATIWVDKSTYRFYRRALQGADSGNLVPCSIRRDRNRKKEETYQLVAAYCKEERKGVTLYVHAVIAELFCEDWFKGCSIHHIDRNKLNNDPSNLMCLTGSEHSKLHASCSDFKWLREKPFYRGKKGKEHNRSLIVYDTSIDRVFWSLSECDRFYNKYIGWTQARLAGHCKNVNGFRLLERVDI